MSSEINFLGSFVIQIDANSPPNGIQIDANWPPIGKAKPVGTGSNRINYPIDIDKDKIRLDKKKNFFSQKLFFKEGTRVKALTGEKFYPFFC